MGTLKEDQILNQTKKGQAEANQRLDAIKAALEEQTALLRQLLDALAVRR